MLGLAGRKVRLTIVGATLDRLVFPTFSHLVAPDSHDTEPDGPSIRIWDCAATGVPRPPLPDAAGWRSGGEGWQATAYDRSRYLCEERPDSTIWFDRATAGLIEAFADARRLTVSDGARPLQRMVSEFCRTLGAQDVHAGLVSLDGRGAMIVGGSGRGKTTTSIDGFYGGLDFLGDDSVAVARADDGSFTGYSIYGSARVFPAQTARWPGLSGRWIEPEAGEEKAVLFPDAAGQGRVVAATRIAAIVVPVIGSGRAAINRTTPRDAFHALVRDSRAYHLRFGMQPDDFSRLAALTTTLPCYRFELDNDPGRVAEGLREIIDGSGRP
ncbi:MAG: hypothetical protein ABI399_00845 [Bauldia sp.]